MALQEPVNCTIDQCYKNAHYLLKQHRLVSSSSDLLNTTVYPVWIGDSDCFWYIRDLKNGGKEYRLVNARTSTNEPAFNHQKLANVLTKRGGNTIEPEKLPLSKVEIAPNPTIVYFSAFEKRWQFDASCSELSEIAEPHNDEELLSPDGKLLVFAKDHNLWLRDLHTNEEKPLTTDGQQYYSYGAKGSAWAGDDMGLGLQALWSPDSKRFFTVQRDTREVKELPVVHHVPTDGTIRPQLKMHRYALPGDDHVETLRLVAIDLATGRQIPASYPQIPTTRNGFGFFSANLGWWGKDSRIAYFVDVDRYYKYARLMAFDTHTGDASLILEETSDTHVLLMQNGDTYPAYLPLPDTDEVLWYSDRSGWAHVYLYDLKTGKLKNSVTEGEWLVREIVHFDPERREVFLQTGGRTEGRNPYYRDLIRVNIDTAESVAIVSGDYEVFAGAPLDMQTLLAGMVQGLNGIAGASSSANYIVVTKSRIDSIPESVLVDRDGKEVLTVETADISSLPEGWCWPEPVQVMAADGKTDIYGVIFYPLGFTPDKKYPVVSYTYNTPDFPWAARGSFDNSDFLGTGFYEAASLAALGFIVVQIDGRGAAYRSKAFMDESYGWVESAGFMADHVAGLKQLADERPYMDMERVGIYSPGGGIGSVQGMLEYPELYKVGMQGILHDSRLMGSAMWGDMFEGTEASSDKYFPEDKVENLRGKLLITAGMLDSGATPPATAFRLVEALQKANKDFDMILLPNLGHELSPYLIRRSWDYLVRHLLGVEPPKEFPLTGILGTPEPNASDPDSAPVT